MPILASGKFLRMYGRVDLPLGLVVRLPAHRPREVLGIVPLGGAGGHEQVRHLLLVHVLVDGGVGRGAERLEQRGHFVLLDQLADHLDGLGRAVAVVVADVVDLPAVDAALVVDLLEVGAERLADGAVRRGRTAIGVGVADLDLGRGDSGRLRGRRAQRHRQPERCQQRDLQAFPHRVLLDASIPGWNFGGTNLTSGNPRITPGVPRVDAASGRRPGVWCRRYRGASRT